MVLFFGLSTAQLAHAELGDPTRPPDLDVGSFETFLSGDVPIEVTSILIAPERQIAIVNGLAVAVGDSVAGARVLEILPHAVWLETSEGEIEVPISASPVKVAVGGNEEEAE